ncbi:putative LOC100569746 [Trichonephila clavipes]|nr:putative LOC100569746 [Trichonephila clavipes]
MATSKNKTAAFEEANPQVATITNFFIPELNNHDVQELWFQQDGATCHTARATIDLLKDTFGDRLISRFGPVNWPPRSYDLTPLDYFLWGYVKSLVYADKPQMLDHLEDNIRRVIADIRSQMLEKSSKIERPDWTTSEPAVAVLCQKSYLKCIAVIRRDNDKSEMQPTEIPFGLFHNGSEITIRRHLPSRGFIDRGSIH